jgi:lysophospholipase L1-like esterase
MKGKSGLKIAFFGDSLTEGNTGASYFNILRQKLSRHELFNYGRGGDTVISLYRRLLQIDTLDAPMDMGFLWIGVNDVLVRTRRSLPLIKRLRKQPWAGDRREFKEYYRSILELLQHKIGRLVTLPPLFIGEDLDNPWNRELAALSDIIRDVTGTFPHAGFLDLRERFSSLLASKNTSPFVPKNIIGVVSDSLFTKAPEELEKRAFAKGLHFTIDGVHLNTTGACMVAQAIQDKIRSDFPFPVCVV